MRFLYAAAIAALAASAPAGACSVVSGYRVPDTLELVERADTIVIGTVEAGADRGAAGVGHVVLGRPSC